MRQRSVRCNTPRGCTQRLTALTEVASVVMASPFHWLAFMSVLSNAIRVGAPANSEPTKLPAVTLPTSSDPPT